MKILKNCFVSIVTVIIVVSSIFGGNLFADTTTDNILQSNDMIAATNSTIIIPFSVAHRGSYTTPTYTCLTDHPKVSFYSCSGGPAHVEIFIGSTSKGTFTIPVTGTTTINFPFSCNYRDKVYFVITAPSSSTSGSFTLYNS